MCIIIGLTYVLMIILAFIMSIFIFLLGFDFIINRFKCHWSPHYLNWLKHWLTSHAQALPVAAPLHRSSQRAAAAVVRKGRA